MYYRIPKEFFIPVIIGDITEEYIQGGQRLFKEDLVEKEALEAADREYIETEIQGGYWEKYKYNLEEDEYYLEINSNIK
ncbi:hypothetical protein [Clostridium vincentii]|uniref:Uncharacterized protein n=1 Tax=Clostridium vincentii TaxID=52704 RepID=A0A2T0BL38_9CLOT|nr:hypothetical protein [Clostridium vincentii]PRR84608.1 hypothetical protein CLVI_01310 [Clostridium vincentii]